MNLAFENLNAQVSFSGSNIISRWIECDFICHGQDAIHKNELKKLQKKHEQKVNHLKLGIGLGGACVFY